MIDFHTHILPRMDDGSKSVEESLSMLDSMRKQGIDTVIATPHFYANDESVDSFIERREVAASALRECASEVPQITLGAEVKYYDGISHLSDLKKLRVEGSRLLLLEMPFSRWTEYAVNEVIDIASRGKITLVLAHIDRYLTFQKKDTLLRLLDNGVVFQANAEFVTGFGSKAKALKMIRNNQIHFIGSDSHNMTSRIPNAGKAFSVIVKRYGEAFLEDYIDYQRELLLSNKL